MGKTRLKEQLAQYLSIYEPGYDAEWFDDYEDGKYDLVVFDEFKGQYKPTVMNTWLDGQYTTLRRRGRTPVRKRQRVPCIVLSNYNVSQCYHRLAKDHFGLEALQRRVLQVYMAQRIDIQFTFPSDSE